jgi:glutaredoxin
MRCEQHGLAVGPGGACVVCLREARGRAEQRARRLVAGFIGLLLLSCGGLLATRLLRTPLIAQPPLRAAKHPGEPASPAPAPRQAEPRQAEPRQAEPREAEPREAEMPSVGQPVAAISALPPPISAVAAAAPAPPARVLSKRELTAAVQATPVSMFSTSWCRHCQRARQFFQTHGLRVVDHDIDVDARAAAELKRRSGGKAVPLIDVDGLELRGFDERATMAAVIASVERRLGVTGVKLSVGSVSN